MKGLFHRLDNFSKYTHPKVAQKDCITFWVFYYIPLLTYSLHSSFMQKMILFFYEEYATRIIVYIKMAIHLSHTVLDRSNLL